MWYESDKKDELDYSKPIAAERAGNIYLLTPQIEKGSYQFVGYNWLDVRFGVYNSSVCFKTVKEACASYLKNHDVHNVNIILEPVS